MKKKLLRFVCTSLMTVVCMSVNAQTSGSCGTNATWEYDSGTLTITGTGEITQYDNPNNYPWNNATAQASFNPKGINDGVHDYTMYWTGITSIVIGEGITNVPDYAFTMQLNCASITLPSTLTYIGASSLNECAFTNISIPNTVTEIGVYAFMGCEKLSNINIPTSANFTTLKEGILMGCTALTALTIPNNVTTIDDMAIESIGITSITIPGSVTSIGAMNFEGCDALETVTIQNGVQTIGATAFDGCTALTTITIPESVSTIGNGVFGGCNAINKVIFNRTFPKDIPQTICMPFAPTELLSKGDVYKFTGISGTKAQMTKQTTPLSANTPYIFIPSSDVTSITFDNATDFATNFDNDPSYGTGFTFNGSYSGYTWVDADPKIYGFSANSYGGKTQGQFMQCVDGTTIKPFRAYLKYDDNTVLDGTTTSTTRGLGLEDLPEVIEIEWISATGTTSINHINTISNDTTKWYSIDGRQLSRKPTAKGVYIHNGQKFVVR